LNNETKVNFCCKEAADYLGVHVNFIYAHPEIPRVCFGKRKYVFRKETLDRFLAENERALCKK